METLKKDFKCMRMCYFTVKTTSFNHLKVYSFLANFRGLDDAHKLLEVVINGEIETNVNISFCKWYGYLSEQERVELIDFISRVLEVNEDYNLYDVFYQKLTKKLKFSNDIIELRDKIIEIGFVSAYEPKISFTLGNVSIYSLYCFDSYDNEHIIVKFKNQKLFDFYFDCYNYDERIVIFLSIIINLIQLQK